MGYVGAWSFCADLPSLLLNLADDHRSLKYTALASMHLAAARDLVEHLSMISNAR
jgi:hypothetical protein